MKQNLSLVLSDNEIISVSEFSRRHGYSRTTLTRNFPALCDELIIRYSKYKEQLKKERINKVKNEIKTAIIELHNEGYYPNKVLVANKISNPCCFMDPILSKYRKKIIKSLVTKFKIVIKS